MNRKEYAKLSDEEKRIKVAELCGWKRKRVGTLISFKWYLGEGGSNGCSDNQLPNYLNDLNAMHEAEKLMSSEQSERFRSALHHSSIGGGKMFGEAICHATAAQRAKAFVLTMEG